MVRSPVVIVAVVSLAAAGAVALASRAPAHLRDATLGRSATDPDHGARFTQLEVRRGAAYSRPGYVGFVAGAVLEIVLLVVLTRGPWTRLVERVQGVPGGWVTQAALLGAVVAVLLWASALPLGYVRGYVVEHAWNLSTQGVAGWFGDRLRSLLVSGVIGALTALAYFAVVRWQPRTWWLWVWAVFTLLTAVLFFLWPVLIAPLFNNFRPLEDGALRSQIEHLAREAHVDLDEVLVADASRRTTAENAYVAGFGGTRRLVLYDTLLRAGKSDETLFVVGHELGHEVEHHVLRGLFLASGGLLVGSAVLAWLSTRDGLWRWVGANGVTDLRAVPGLLLFATVATLLTLPVQNAFSRRFEATADRIAIRLTKDPATATRVLRRLGLANVADLEPPTIAVAVLYSHPPIPERIERVRDFASGAS